jgi:hypothetical protein
MVKGSTTADEGRQTKQTKLEAMPLDEITRRLANAFQRDLDRLAEQDQSRSSRGEEVRVDSVSRMATAESRRGDVIGRWYTETIASYSPSDRLLRWAWAGRTSLATPSFAEVIAQEGQSRGAPQLTVSLVPDLDEADAITLARLGVVVARGEGMQILRLEGELRFLGLFDSPRPKTRTPPAAVASRYSVPPPPVAPASRQSGSTPAGKPPSGPPSAYRSIPPIREIYAPRSTPGSAPDVKTRRPSEANEEAKVREPSRALFVPVATAALTALGKVVPRFQQAIFVISMMGDGPSRRLGVLLVAVDASGVLRALDPTTELVEAAGRMVEADRQDGNGPWRKLSARITPKPDGGATLHVDVI